MGENIEYGNFANLSAKVVNIKDGEYANIAIYEEQDRDHPLYETGVVVKDSKVQHAWKVLVPKERLEKLKKDEKLKFIFTVKVKGKSVDSDPFEAVFVYRMDYTADTARDTSNDTYTLKSSDGSYKQTLTETDDKVLGDKHITLSFKDVLPGKDYSLVMKIQSTEEIWFEQIPFLKLILEQG